MMGNVNWHVIIKYGFTSVLPAAFVVVMGIVFIVFLERQASRLMQREAFAQSTIIIVKKLIRWVCGVLTLLGVATILGVEIKPLWAAITAVLAMAAIGFFAGWSLISSSLAMLIILFWRPFDVGDEIEILPDGIKGKLEGIDSMFCRIKEHDGKILVIANSQMLQKMVRHYSSSPSEPPVARDD